MGVGALTRKFKLGICKVTCIVCSGLLPGFENGQHHAGLLLDAHLIFPLTSQT